MRVSDTDVDAKVLFCNRVGCRIFESCALKLMQQPKGKGVELSIDAIVIALVE